MNRWRTAPVLLLGLALTAAGCGGGTGDAPAPGAGAADAPAPDAGPDPGTPDATTPRLVELPDLSTAAAQVRRQVGRAQEELERLRTSGAGDEELAGAYGELGLILLTYQFFDAAEGALTRAHALQPDSLRWTYLLGCVHRWLGRPERAAELLRRTLEMKPDYVPALVRLGRLRLEAGDGAAARELFAEALEIAPDSAAAWEGAGRAAAARGDHEEAVDHFRRALELAPGADSLHYRLGQALRRTGRMEEAAAELARAGDVAVVLRDPLLQDLAGVADNVQRYLVQGGEAMQDRRYGDAAAAFRKAAELEPESYRALSGLGWALKELGDPEGAEERLRGAVEVASNPVQRAEGTAALSSVLLAAGDDAGAVEALRASLAERPQQPHLRRRLADALARLGRFGEALDELDALLAPDSGLAAAPEDAGELRVRRALVLVNLGRGDEAVAELRRAVAAAPSDVALRLRLAETLDHLGRDAEAERERRAARELSAGGGAEDRATLWINEGRELARGGDAAGAVERYRRALEVAPERHDVRVALASLLGRTGRYDEALVEFGRVIEAEPDNAAARRGEIAALILSGRYGPARMRLNDALRRFSRDHGLALTQVRLLAAAPEDRVRDGELALRVARRVAADHDDPLTRDSLAMALAESGRTGEAARVQRELVAEARERGAEELAGRLAERLAAYEAGRAWRAAEPAELLAFRLIG